MSAVTILTSALQDDSGAGAAVDVSTFSTLRLNWSALADVGRLGMGYLRLFIETGPSASGPWRIVYERQLNSGGWDPAPRAVLSGFDSFVRARWDGKMPRVNNEQSTKFFTIALTGDGQPNAA
ncbi:MAG TPA: hypothetical protein VJN18_14825 [Polyangiaceae bacterium]|nr:hypothetical protein [Polyangiaceae bacterium]